MFFRLLSHLVRKSTQTHYSRVSKVSLGYGMACLLKKKNTAYENRGGAAATVAGRLDTRRGGNGGDSPRILL